MHEAQLDGRKVACSSREVQLGAEPVGYDYALSWRCARRGEIERRWRLMHRQNCLRRLVLKLECAFKMSRAEARFCAGIFHLDGGLLDAKGLRPALNARLVEHVGVDPRMLHTNSRHVL